MVGHCRSGNIRPLLNFPHSHSVFFAVFNQNSYDYPACFVSYRPQSGSAGVKSHGKAAVFPVRCLHLVTSVFSSVYVHHYSTILPPRFIGEENQAHCPSPWHKILTFSPESPIIITSVTKREEGETPSQSCCRDGFLPQPEYLCRTLAFHRE